MIAASRKAPKTWKTIEITAYRQVVPERRPDDRVVEQALVVGEADVGRLRR